MSFIGASFSMHPNAYEQYKETKDGEIFEKLISDIILNKHSDNQNLTEFILSLPKEKQRLAVLSLIDKERKGDVNHLWSEMVSYVNDNVNKMDHIKDVIKIINKFVKDGEVEKKKHGEVMTPITLVREMLDTLPVEVWSNPNLKWLDPANGAGTFPFVIIYKLMNGLSEWEPNEEKRYKHIVESMIYTCELQSRNVFLWLCGVDPKDEYTTNTYWGSFLDEGFDKHMKDVWSVDKFDIVIGNPPYNTELDYDKGSASPLYNLFTEKSLKITDNVLFVTPSKWFAGGKGLDKFRKIMLNSNNIEYIVHYENSKDIFSTIELKGGISYFLFNKKYQGLTNFNGVNLKLNTFDIIPTNVSKTALSIINRVKDLQNISKICKGQSYASITSNDGRLTKLKSDNSTVCYVSQQKGLKMYIDKDSIKNIDTLDNYKVFTSRTYGAGPAFNKSFYIGYPGEVCSQSYIAFIVKNMEEAESLKSYLTTKFVNLLLSFRKITQDIKPDTCSWIPLVPFNIQWNDQKLFRYFNLTEKEEDLILEKDRIYLINKNGEFTKSYWYEIEDEFIKLIFSDKCDENCICKSIRYDFKTFKENEWYIKYNENFYYIDNTSGKNMFDHRNLIGGGVRHILTTESTSTDYGMDKVFFKLLMSKISNNEEILELENILEKGITQDKRECKLNQIGIK